ncbi:hypothetical protein BT63DRAFT_309340 [Microthyrium microscopicum]|uniref:Uncharacterized protein n=1 Tax=Microthyrium microscopicum TaxID=703497 RepID=A0A6A6U926_9PEZI|nr:hypothetical protein BT63DRAFT_309340 [Microthyrium microscopicum]
MIVLTFALLSILGSVIASKQEDFYGPGFFYVELPGQTYFGRLEDVLLGRQTGRVCRIQLDGHQRREIYIFKDESEIPDSVAVDEGLGRIYFTSGRKQANNTWEGKIQQINTDGTDLRTIITTNSLPTALKLVEHPNKKMLYWVEGTEGLEGQAGHLIKRFNVNNRTEIETVIDTKRYACSIGVNATACPPVQDMAIDTRNMDIYWTQSLRWTLIPGSLHKLSLSMKPEETATNRSGVQMLLKDERHAKRIQYVDGSIYWVTESNSETQGSWIKRLGVEDWGKKDPEVVAQVPKEQGYQIIDAFAVDARQETIWAMIGFTFSHFHKADLKGGGGFKLLRQWMAVSRSLVRVG